MLPFSFHLLHFILISSWFSNFINFHISAYNLDINNAIVFSDPQQSEHSRGSYFGFSVALYTFGKDSVVLVGAPRGNSSYTPTISEPGTVYKCPVNDVCKEWPIDETQNGIHPGDSHINQIKDNAWIGATIAVENTTDPKVVVCGPRWKNQIIKNYKSKWYMNGACYWTMASNILTSEAHATMIRPLSNSEQQVISTNGIGIYYFGMAQSGFSLHISSNELRWDLVLGSPGISNWKGTPYLITQGVFDTVERTIVPASYSTNQMRSGDYFGYTVTSGHYLRKEELLYASGAPRAADMNGKVLIFTFPSQNNRRLNVRKSLNGQQHGEYFGAALASCDVNGDSREDLIVGAPLWSKDMDEGRVYVFIGRHGDVFETQLLEGEISGGRFGTALSCLGDIDYDDYGDIAIGAPYEGESGAIYIFNGNINGVSKKYSQKIVGSEVSHGIRGFGISISEPRDINGDRYSDIAVGAYLSENVILFKSKPVVTVTLNLQSSEKKRLLRNTTFFYVETCIFYEGVYAPEDLQIVVTLKIDQMHDRAVYLTETNSSNTYNLSTHLRRTDTTCNELRVHLKNNIQNVIDPIKIFASVSLENDTPENKWKNNSGTSYAVINKALSKTEDFIELPFAVDCGDDNICTSDLELKLSLDLNSDVYVIGSTSTLKVIVDVYTYEEPAYQSKVHIYIPEILSLASIPTQCIENSRVNNTLEISCDIGNPLRKNKTVTVELDTSEIRFGIDSLTLRAIVTTQSDEIHPENNNRSKTIYFGTDIDIAIAGKAQEDLYSYVHKNGEEKLRDLRFQHVYEVQKFGVSPIEEAILIIKVPTRLKSATGDIEIVSVNQTNGYIDGRPFYCYNANDTEIESMIMSIESLSITNQTEKARTHEKFTIDEKAVINLPHDNRTFYVNCTNPVIQCKKLECRLGAFVSSLSVARLLLTLDLHLSNVQLNMMEGKDIIFFVSEGSVNIAEPYNIGQSGNKPDSTIIATTFVGSPVPQKMATWIIAVSVFLGILLLILLILGLIKIGFFNRKKKEELEALKAETSDPPVTIETTSSREVLEQE